MCLVWRYRLVVSIVLVVVLCDVFASDAQPLGKVYPRGNHWAVGHLMGKKSTDERAEPEDSEGDDMTSVPLDQDLQLERNNKQLLLPVLYALMRGRMTPESSQEVNAHKLLDRMLTRWKEVHERSSKAKMVEDIKQALSMQDDNES